MDATEVRVNTMGQRTAPRTWDSCSRPPLPWVAVRISSYDQPPELQVLGGPVADDIHRLQQAIEHLKINYPDLADRYLQMVQNLNDFKGEIVLPAIQLYSEYLREPEAFFAGLQQHQSAWIPILEGAMACLDPGSDFYQQCRTLKHQIDESLQQ